MICDHAKVLWNKSLIELYGPEEAQEYWKNMTLNHLVRRNYYNGDLPCISNFGPLYQFLMSALGLISILVLGLIEPII